MNSLTGFLDALSFRVNNIIEIVPKELEAFNLTIFIYSFLIFLLFYALSRWVKVFIVRLFFLVVGVFVLWNVFAQPLILHHRDFYISLGLIVPQIEIVEYSFMILKEKLFIVYTFIASFLRLIISPLVWLYVKSSYIYSYLKAKQKEEQQEQQEYREYEQNYNQEYSDHKFQEEQYQEYQRQHQRRDEKERRQQQQKREEQSREKEKQREEAKQKYEQEAKKHQKKKHPRWDSSDPYIVLGVDRNASKEEIKKKYRELCVLYHPDKEQDEEKRKIKDEIQKRINSAYRELK